MDARQTCKLTVNQLCSGCSLDDLNFESTEELIPLQGVIGQDRASRALDFGLSMKKRGYNIYVSGNWGSGRNSYVRLITEEKAIKRDAPKDWIYVNNFKNAHNPLAISVETGTAKEFIKQVEKIINFLRKEIEDVFNSKDYENAKAGLIQEYNVNNQAIINELNDIGAQYGFKFSQTEKGLVSIPLKNGEPMSEEEYREISDGEYEVLRGNSNKLSIETVDLFNKLRFEEEELRRKIKNLEERMGRRIVSFQFMNLREKHKDNSVVKDYIDALIEDIVEHVEHFRGEEEQEQPNPLAMFQMKDTESFFNRYKMNLFIDNCEVDHAPIVFASNPTYYNLLGSIEYRNELGVMKTDFTQIKPGLLHEANGGYLIILAKDILSIPYAWKGLKRALLDREISIESIGAQTGAVVSTTLKPQAIPLDVKIIVIGDPYAYHMLYSYDEEFRKLFKVMADFDVEMDRNRENISKMSRFIAKHCEKDDLKHFDQKAVGKLIEYSSRLADDQNKLSAHLNKLVDVLYEADRWAEVYNSRLVKAEHVVKALEENKYRSNKYEEKVFEMFKEGTYLIDVDGYKVGEINGLAVTGSGQYGFGKPSKITVSTYKGRSGFVNIEREARQSGSHHDKGVMILTGFIGDRFAKDKPLALTANIVFEQSYSMIDGDSASSTELYAILSSLSGVAINQSIAVTGSVNQRGDIQPIGGVNEKIEGFYKVCKIKGLNGQQGVMIPHQNVKNLMLCNEVKEAVEKGDFHIYAIEHIEQGIEILTGVEAGEVNKRGNYPRGSVFYKVDKRLKELGKPMLPPKKKESDKATEEEKETKEVKEEKE